jgi:hypothetical protein
MRVSAIMGRLLLCLLFLGLLSAVQAGDGDLKAKGQIKIGVHPHKMKAGELYIINVEGQGFRPLVNIRPGFLPFNPSFDQRNSFHSHFVPMETKEHRLYITPDTFGDLGDGALEYSVSVKHLPLDEKPLLSKQEKLTDQDPFYKPERKTHFKAHTVKLKADRYYVIDLVKGTVRDPYLFLEDSNNKVVASDDDGGGNLNSRIVFRPKADGDFRVIVTTLGLETGELTLTVRQAKE